MLFHLDCSSSLIFLLAAKLFQKDLLWFQLLGKILRGGGGWGGESIFRADWKLFTFSLSRFPYAVFMNWTSVCMRKYRRKLAYTKLPFRFGEFLRNSLLKRFISYVSSYKNRVKHHTHEHQYLRWKPNLGKNHRCCRRCLQYLLYRKPFTTL